MWPTDGTPIGPTKGGNRAGAVRESGESPSRDPRRPRRRSELVRLILVVAAQPEVRLTFLVPPHRRPVEQAVVPHGELDPTRAGHISAVDDPVRKRVRAQARPLRDVAHHVHAARLGHLLDGRGYLALQERSQLLLRMREAEISVEVAAGRRNPFQAPAHPLLVRPELLERRTRDEQHRHVARGEVDDVRVEVVRDRGADGAAGLVRRAEHEVVDEQLGAPVEQLGERLGALLGLEAVLLLDRHPGKFPPLLRQLVVAAGELLLLREQLIARRLPLLLCADPVLRHRSLLSGWLFGEETCATRSLSFAPLGSFLRSEYTYAGATSNGFVRRNKEDENRCPTTNQMPWALACL